MSQYKYTPLKDEARDIRLLTLLPRSASPTNKIHILINHVILSKESHLEYTALSYTWGSVENSSIIYVGVTEEYVLQVTEKLFVALEHMRYEDEKRVMWIDAVCIDQSNVEERGHQVRRMADIYQFATDAIMWLGSSDEHSKLALDALQHLATKVEIDWDGDFHPKPSQDAIQSQEEHWADCSIQLPCSIKQLTGIYHLLCRSWFERVWIRQEVMLSREKAVLFCGVDNLKKRLELIFPICRKLYPETLSRLLPAIRAAKCSDPRDKVFGVLSMIQQNLKQGLEPDYTKTTAEVYQSVALNSIQIYKRLDILFSCNLEDKATDMPSWVPNWQVLRHFESFTYHSASGRSICRTKYCDGILSISGVNIATVKKASNTYPVREFGLVPIINAIRENAPDLGKNYVDGSSMFDAYLHTLCLGNFSKCTEPSSKLMVDYAISRRCLIACLNTPYTKKELESSDFEFFGTSRRSLAYRCFFTTHEGYFGFGPPGIRPGDQVCVFLGCNASIILRPAGCKKYQVVGPAYTHGMMTGEGFLGPLPKSYQAVHWIPPNAKRYSPGFINRETGVIETEDPRKGILPGGWVKIENLKNNYHERFRNEETGEETWHDPRLSVEALQKRGVKLVTFDLV